MTEKREGERETQQQCLVLVTLKQLCLKVKANYPFCLHLFLSVSVFIFLPLLLFDNQLMILPFASSQSHIDVCYMFNSTYVH